MAWYVLYSTNRKRVLGMTDVTITVPLIDIVLFGAPGIFFLFYHGAYYALEKVKSFCYKSKQAPLHRLQARYRNRGLAWLACLFVLLIGKTVLALL